MPPSPTSTSPRVRVAALVFLAATLHIGLHPGVADAKPRNRATVGFRRVRAPYPGGAPSMEAAIRATWPPSLHRQAMNVAWCESRGRASARNGQYRGHFQIGTREWSRYGRGNPYNGFDNSAAAYRYFRIVGSWSPWQCQP
jgi:hypothetical protein